MSGLASGDDGTGPGSLRDRARGALLGVAVGDTFGAPFEGTPIVWPEEVAALEHGRGRLLFTDDTQMTIGLAESLLACGGFDPDHCVATFADDYKRESWRAYGAGPPQIFRLVAEGMSVERAAGGLFDGEGSFGNGGAMRVAPVAVAAHRDLPTVAELAAATARVTHTHPEGVDGAVVQAVAVAVVLRGDSGRPTTAGPLVDAVLPHVTTDGLGERLERLRALPGPGGAAELATGEAVMRFGNGVAAVESVPAALAAFLLHPDDFRGAIRFAIGMGGDTDTIAAMAGALVGAEAGESGLPPGWVDRAEGAAELRELADRLLELGSRLPGA